VCCSVLQCVAVCCSVLQCVAVCCSVLQCVAVCCILFQCVAEEGLASALQCVAVCCSTLQYVAVCCGVLPCVAEKGLAKFLCHDTYMNDSRHTCKWVMSHLYMSHVTHMTMSCHTPAAQREASQKNIDVLPHTRLFLETKILMSKYLCQINMYVAWHQNLEKKI